MVRLIQPTGKEREGTQVTYLPPRWVQTEAARAIIAGNEDPDLQTFFQLTHLQDFLKSPLSQSREVEEPNFIFTLSQIWQTAMQHTQIDPEVLQSLQSNTIGERIDHYRPFAGAPYRDPSYTHDSSRLLNVFDDLSQDMRERLAQLTELDLLVIKRYLAISGSNQEEQQIELPFLSELLWLAQCDDIDAGLELDSLGSYVTLIGLPWRKVEYYNSRHWRDFAARGGRTIPRVPSSDLALFSLERAKGAMGIPNEPFLHAGELTRRLGKNIEAICFQIWSGEAQNHPLFSQFQQALKELIPILPAEYVGNRRSRQTPAYQTVFGYMQEIGDILMARSIASESELSSLQLPESFEKIRQIWSLMEEIFGISLGVVQETRYTREYLTSYLLMVAEQVEHPIFNPKDHMVIAEVMIGEPPLSRVDIVCLPPELKGAVKKAKQRAQSLGRTLVYLHELQQAVEQELHGADQTIKQLGANMVFVELKARFDGRRSHEDTRSLQPAAAYSQDFPPSIRPGFALYELTASGVRYSPIAREGLLTEEPVIRIGCMLTPYGSRIFAQQEAQQQKNIG